MKQEHRTPTFHTRIGVDNVENIDDDDYIDLDSIGFNFRTQSMFDEDDPRNPGFGRRRQGNNSSSSGDGSRRDPVSDSSEEEEEMEENEEDFGDFDLEDIGFNFRTESRFADDDPRNPSFNRRRTSVSSSSSFGGGGRRTRLVFGHNWWAIIKNRTYLSFTINN